MKKEHILVTIGKERFENYENYLVHFVDDKDSNIFLNNIEKYPHAYVLACGMDRQIKAEKAWMIPVHVKNILGTFDINKLSEVPQKEYEEIFQSNSLHRFNSIMAETFYKAIHEITGKYNGDATNIWNNTPSSSAVVYRFLQFKGYGIKIATMATNILARQFRIPFSDYYSIDISPDVHIIRVMKRSGLVDMKADKDSIIYKARELNPDFPGIIDYSCWEIGRNWCRPNKPNCDECIIRLECNKIY